MSSSGAHRSIRHGLDELLAHACDLACVFCDLDGTFLDERHRVPARAMEVVGRLEASGVRFLPTTGRTLFALCELFGADFAHLDYVACNGMDVRLDGHVLAHATVPPADAQTLFDAVLASPRALGLVAYGQNGAYIMDVEAEYVVQSAGNLVGSPVRPLSCGLPDEPLSKLAIVAREDVAGAAHELASGLGDRFDFMLCGGPWVDVAVHGHSKLAGARVVLKALGAELGQALAFGDSMNDLELMRGLPLSVAMGNAMPQLKEACTFEIGTNREEAVLDCLEAICKARG